MRGPDISARWGSPQQLYEGYINSFKGQRNQSANVANQPKVTKIGGAKVLSETDDFQTKRVLPDSTKKEVQKNAVDQTRKINLLKTDLSDLKLKVTQIISNDKDFGAVHNGLTPTNDSFYYVKDGSRPIEGCETPRKLYAASQNSTLQKRPADSYEPRIHDQTTNHKPMQAQPRQQPIQSEHQLREDLRASGIRERKLVDERDDLAKRLQDKIRELQALRTFPQNQLGQFSERLRGMPQQRESSQKSMQIVLDGLRRQNSDLQGYYKQKLEEAERDRKSMEATISNKNQELNNMKAQLLNLQKGIKNQENFPKLLESMQETNRKLDRELADSISRIKNEQIKTGNLQERFRKNQELRNGLELEKNSLEEENKKLKDAGRIACEEIIKLKETVDNTVREKNREIQVLIAQRDKLKQSNQVTHANNLLCPPKQEEPNARGKSQMSKSSIFIMGSGSNINHLSETEQTKKQDLDKLTVKIQELKKQKKTIEHEVKSLFETKEAIENSIRNQPKIKSVTELQEEVLLKDQSIAKMCEDIRNLQQSSEASQKLGHRVRINENLLRDANEFIMRRELAILNKKYN